MNQILILQEITRYYEKSYFSPQNNLILIVYEMIHSEILHLILLKLTFHYESF